MQIIKWISLFKFGTASVEASSILRKMHGLDHICGYCLTDNVWECIKVFNVQVILYSCGWVLWSKQSLLQHKASTNYSVHKRISHYLKLNNKRCNSCQILLIQLMSILLSNLFGLVLGIHLKFPSNNLNSLVNSNSLTGLQSKRPYGTAGKMID